MKAESQIDVHIEIEESDAAIIYNEFLSWKLEEYPDHRIKGEELRRMLQSLVNNSVSLALSNYRKIEKKL